MKLGLLVEIEEGLSWSRWRNVLTRAEALGFESVWVSDHLCSPWSQTPATLEAWTALAVAAAETQRIRLGPLVTPVTIRPPALVARMASALGGLSGGRFTLGLGLGWNRAEHAAFGLRFPSLAERARLLKETAEQARGVPVLIGGMGERATLPLVARFADEWNMTTASATRVQQRSAVLDVLCQEIGRDARAIARSVAVGYLVGRDAAELRERSARIREWVAPLAAVAVEAVPDAARGMGWLVGTVDAIGEQVRELERAGVERIIFGHYDLDDLAAMELLAELK
jgi:alkanesulfonate monooxygenase SsuD/methylene tetrahydromethanopterin reductase-like flavin-dependent oxidoreductase (luciferase family)